jgi:hypothetical protein
MRKDEDFTYVTPKNPRTFLKTGVAFGIPIDYTGGIPERVR